jgi:hypothetical protein
MEDLYDFYSNKYKRSTHFSAEKSGHQIFVQIPAKFEITENDYKDNSLLFCKVKIMHSGENRNHSCVTDEALNKASKGLAYKPILANFMEYVDEKTGETLKDFTSHDMEITEDGVNYIEKQIGCFTSDEPFFEVEEETGHRFLYGYCAIPREYTDATSIIERKGGTKISVELAINEMSFNAKSKVLELTDVVIMGATCLGKDPETLEDVGEGMLNARLDIADFSSKNNSLFSDYESKMVELQARLEKLETACFDNKKDNSKEGGNENLSKFEELCQKYEKTVDDITFDYKNMSDDELVEAFAKAFDEADSTDDGSEGADTPSGSETTTDGNEEGENNPTEQNPDESEKGDITEDETPFIDDDEPKKKANNALTRTFEISHDDIRYALYNLLSSYEDADNEWYYITGVYDSYFVYESWDGGKIYGQKYTKDNDNVTLDGERYSLHKTYLTDSEYAEIESMRSNYAELKAFKENVEKNELHSKKESLLADEKYSVLSDNEEFTELKKNMDNYSLDDLETKAKVIFADYVSSVGNFSLNSSNKNKSHSMQLFGDPNTRRNSRSGRYGDIFKK